MEEDRRTAREEVKPEIDEETMASRKMAEACLEEKKLTSVDRKPEVAQRDEVSKKDTKITPVGGLKKRHGDRKSAAGKMKE
jgi:hypothetical protein